MWPTFSYPTPRGFRSRDGKQNMTLIWIFVGKKNIFVGTFKTSFGRTPQTWISTFFVLCLFFWVGLFFSSRFLWDSFYHVHLMSLVTLSQLLAHVSPTKDFSGCQEDKRVWGLRKNFTDSNIHYSIHPQDCLVGGWTNPFEKYACQIGSFPQGKDENQKYLKPPPSCNMEKIFPISAKQRSPRHRRWLFEHPDAWNFEAALWETKPCGSFTGHCNASFLSWFRSGKKNTTSSSPSKLLILMDVSGRICEFYHVLSVFHSILLIPRPVSLVKQQGWAKCA